MGKEEKAWSMRGGQNPAASRKYERVVWQPVGSGKG